MIRTYVDANVLILLGQGREALAEKVVALLESGERKFVYSVFLELELLPSPVRLKRSEEVETYKEYFEKGEAIPVSDVCAAAFKVLLDNPQLSMGDALHVAAAYVGDCREIITLEKRKKPIHNLRGVGSLRPVYLD